MFPKGRISLGARCVGYVTLVRLCIFPNRHRSRSYSRQTLHVWDRVTVRATGDLRETVQSISRVDER